MAPMRFGRTVETVATAIHRTGEIRGDLAIPTDRMEKIFSNSGRSSRGKSHHGARHGHDGIQQSIGDRNGIYP
jgi:hypothetical protein